LECENVKVVAGNLNSIAVKNRKIPNFETPACPNMVTNTA